MKEKIQKQTRSNNLDTNYFFFSTECEHSLRRLFFLLLIIFLSGKPFHGFSIGIDVKSRLVLEAIDKLDALSIFPDTSKNSTLKNSDYPAFPDLVYEFKIAAIDKLSPIDFEYNDRVKRYIDIYTIERRDQVSQMLGLAELYFPLFEDFLDKYQLPLELKYLAVVESALNPLAISKTGAVGLWQFKINTAKMFNLTVNSYIDERRDPIKSTEAACQYLQYLYKIFNDWNLALAAYNTGPGPVRNAIERANGKTDFWKIYDFLPEAAQNYVPAFIAAAYVMNNYADHKIKPNKPLINYKGADTVMVSNPVAMDIISNEIGVSIDIIRFLNPVYRKDYIPELDKKVPLWLPADKIKSFLKKEKAIYSTPIDSLNYHDILANSGSTTNKINIKHKVKAGEYLHKIAIIYGCTIDDLLEWNPETNGDLNIDQVINVWVEKKVYKQLKDDMLLDSLNVEK